MRGHYWSEVQYRRFFFYPCYMNFKNSNCIVLLDYDIHWTQKFWINYFTTEKEILPLRKRIKNSRLSKIWGRTFFDVLRFKRYRNSQRKDSVVCFLVRIANLWNDRQFASQIFKSKFSDINAVDFNSTPWLC